MAARRARDGVIDPDVRVESVRSDGLVGTFFMPSTAPPWPVVMLVGGSSPGIFGIPGVPLASQGFAALALAYFGMPTLPSDLSAIPLEYFGAALRWLSHRSDVRHDAVAVAGASRGGELALLLASEYREIRAAVSWVGSGVVGAAVVRQSTALVPAWTRAGQGLPFAGFDREAVDWNESPVRLTPGFLSALRDVASVERATIPVERINGPVLLVSGADDHVWPSTQLSAIAVDRLRAHRHPFAVEHLVYERAGHVIGVPIPGLSFSITHARHPLIGIDFAFGGTVAANTAASADSWPRIVTFLRSALR